MRINDWKNSKRLAFALGLMAVGILSCTAWGESARVLKIKSVSVDVAYDNIFEPQERGWLGADGAVSVPISATRNLWIFGDTMLGYKDHTGARKGFMVRNSIAIQDLGSVNSNAVKYYWDLTDNVLGDFFSPNPFDAGYWYWPGTGVMVDGELVLFLTKLVEGEGPAGFSFKMTDVTMVRVSNPIDSPNDWKMIYKDLGCGEDHRSFNAAAFVEGNYIYLLGFDDGPSNDGEQRKAVLARMTKKSLHADNPGHAIEYWSEGEQWTMTREKLLPIFKPGDTEASIHYDAKRKLYVAVHLPGFTTDILVHTAPALTGPWTEPQAVYTVPQLATNDKYVAYAGKAHPELSNNPDEIIITYVVNTSDFWGMFSDMSIYYPRFIRLELE